MCLSSKREGLTQSTLWWDWCQGGHRYSLTGFITLPRCCLLLHDSDYPLCFRLWLRYVRVQLRGHDPRCETSSRRSLFESVFGDWCRGGWGSSRNDRKNGTYVWSDEIGRWNVYLTLRGSPFVTNEGAEEVQKLYSRERLVGMLTGEAVEHRGKGWNENRCYE